MKYLINSGDYKILLIMPSNLRKQWQVELDEKFGIDSLIVDSSNWDEYKTYVGKKNPVVIVSYNFASRRKTEFLKTAWNFCIFDEAHRLRNIHKNGSIMANNLFELTKNIPKLMLTATPMQNSLLDLFGLIKFIDERIFYSKAVFSERYIKKEQYEDLKKNDIDRHKESLDRMLAYQGKYLKFLNMRKARMIRWLHLMQRLFLLIQKEY